MPDREPDPTALARFERELERLGSQLKSQIFSETGSVQKLLETRLDGMDTALKRAEDFPTDLDRASARLEALFDQKLGAQKELFEEKIKGLKTLMEEQRQSAETAITKSEGATKEQLISTTKLIDGIKERVDKAEGATAGALKLWGLLMAAAVLVLGMMGFILTKSDEPQIQYQPVPQQTVAEERR